MAMTEMERHVIASIKERFGNAIDLDKEPAVLLEILRRYKNDLDRSEAAPEEYVQVRTGAVGGVAQARGGTFSGTGQMSEKGAAVAGEITNGELMRELHRLRKEVSALAVRIK